MFETKCCLAGGSSELLACRPSNSRCSAKPSLCLGGRGEWGGAGGGESGVGGWGEAGACRGLRIQRPAPPKKCHIGVLFCFVLFLSFERLVGPR